MLFPKQRSLLAGNSTEEARSQSDAGELLKRTGRPAEAHEWRKRRGPACYAR